MRLREPDDGDVELVRAYYRRNAARFLPWEPVPADTTEAFRSWIGARRAESRAGGAVSFLAFSHGTDDLAAIVTLGGFSNEGEGPSAMVSYTVDGAFEGLGIASEAVRRVLLHARETLGLRSLSAYYHPDNARSERLLQRLGFVEVARTTAIPGFEHLMRPNVVAMLRLGDPL